MRAQPYGLGTPWPSCEATDPSWQCTHLQARPLSHRSNSSTALPAREQQLANGDFFKQAKRSISHDKSVLQRLEKHPLAHASGWQISETQVNPTRLCVIMPIELTAFVEAYGRTHSEGMVLSRTLETGGPRIRRPRPHSSGARSGRARMMCWKKILRPCPTQ